MPAKRSTNSSPLSSRSAMTAPASGVKVRMYRQGLGDCFLLAFPTSTGKRPFYMLIDCGVLLGTPDAQAKMVAVADSIREATGGRIDLLVATHQHWDHLSGFQQAREIFDQIEIGEVWVAWTEDAKDTIANRLRSRRENTIRALFAATRTLRVLGIADSANALDPILGFFGDLDSATDNVLQPGEPLSRYRVPVQQAMDYVLQRGDPPRYCIPGEPPLPLGGVPGVNVYVLGPPRDERLLLRSNPSRRASEVYEKRLALNEEVAFFEAVLAGAPKAGEMSPAGEVDLGSLSVPFDRMYHLTAEAAQLNQFFLETYYDEDLAWRRIDSDWLNTAESLALRLDNDTNNTSLALAIELSPGGKVLLFPGDAQVGNWLSWHNLNLAPAADYKGPVTAADLLRRTVLYKVGHHGSHNATLRERGLELMSSQELIAMIPVDESMARKPKGGSARGWDMPFGPLLDRLREKTQSRILRSDLGLNGCPEGMTRSAWERFRSKCSQNELFIEVTIHD